MKTIKVKLLEPWDETGFIHPIGKIVVWDSDYTERMWRSGFQFEILKPEDVKENAAEKKNK